MIEVLSSAIGATEFSTVESVAPYKHKYNIPISKLEYCDSVFNTQHDGILTQWYIKDEVGNVTTSYSGYTPSIKFYSGQGVPPTLLNYKNGQSWGVNYSGYFQPPITANYTFYFAGEGLASASWLSAYSSGSFDSAISIDSDHYVTLGPFVAPALQQVNFSFSYELKNKTDDAGFICLWQTDSASYTPEKVVMSGDVLTKTGTGTLPSFSRISRYSNISLKEKEDVASQLTFEVPFVSEDNFTGQGYRYKSTTDSYVDINSGDEIKEYRTIRYQQGYKVGNNEEYVTKFTGQIRDLKIKYSSKMNDSLVVSCVDFSVFTKDTINLMSPTPIDYWQAGYIDNIPGRANGISMPRTYDGWEVHKAYECILTDCGISPTSFLNKNQYKDYNGDVIEGSFLIEPLSMYSLSTAEVPILPVNTNYGLSPIGEVEGSEEDDEYLYSISTGEYYKDAIDKMMKSWNYKWGFNENGYPFIKRINAPISVINDRDMLTSGTWTEERNVNAIKGTYIESSVTDSIASCDATGKKFALLLGAGPDCSTCNVIIRNGSEVILDTNYNLYFSTAHFYYDGPSLVTGINDSLYKIANGLDYDTYRIVVKHTGTTGKITRIEGIFGYDEEYETPSQVFYTDDTTENATITKLDVQKDIDSQRTDCVVLGRRTGTVFKRNEKGEEITLNRNNPVYTYVQSSARDLNSVYCSTATNYVGRPRMTVIKDPSIASQDQADFISYSVVSEYNFANKNAPITLAGNPLVQVNDCIAVSDDYKSGISSSEYLWVTGVQNTFNNTKYETKIETSPIMPMNSYWSRPQIDLSEYDGHCIWNLKINNGGHIGVLYSFLDSASSGALAEIRVNKNFMEHDSGMSIDLNNVEITDTSLCCMVPGSGYCRIGSEIIKYDSADVVGNENYIRLKGLTRNIPDGIVSKHHYQANFFNDYEKGDQVVIGYLPYSLDAWSPTVEFDLLTDADVEVSIKNFTRLDEYRVESFTEESGYTYVNYKNLNISEFLVDSLTNIDNKIGIDDFKYLKAGHYSFAWGGLDRNGEYNNSVKTKDEVSLLDADLYARENYSIRYSSTAFSTEYRLPGFHGGRHDLSYSTGYGLFFSEIRVNPRIDPSPRTYTSVNEESYNYSTTDSRAGKTTIKQILIDPSIIDLKFSTSGLYYATPISQGYNWYTYEREDRNPINSVEWLHVATNYPTSEESCDISVPTFITNHSNSNEIGASQGFLFHITDYSSNNDCSIVNTFLPMINFQFVQLCWGDVPDGSGKKIEVYEPVINTGTLSEDGGISILIPGKDYRFNIQKWTQDKKIPFIPEVPLRHWKQKNNTDYPNNIFSCMNYILFDDNLYDLSGRKIRQVKYWEELRLYAGSSGYKNPSANQAFNESYNQGKAPFGFSIRGDTSVGAEDETNRGFYEFLTKGNTESDKYTWFIQKFSGSPEVVGAWTSRNYYKNIPNETGKSIIYECLDQLGVNRTNYLHWLNESEVREVRVYNDANRDFNSVRSNIYNLNMNIFVPNVWFTWKYKDFL